MCCLRHYFLLTTFLEEGIQASRATRSYIHTQTASSAGAVCQEAAIPSVLRCCLSCSFAPCLDPYPYGLLERDPLHQGKIVERAKLTQRNFELDLTSRLGKSQVVTNSTPLNQQVQPNSSGLVSSTSSAAVTCIDFRRHMHHGSCQPYVVRKICFPDERTDMSLYAKGDKECQPQCNSWCKGADTTSLCRLDTIAACVTAFLETRSPTWTISMANGTTELLAPPCAWSAPQPIRQGSQPSVQAASANRFYRACHCNSSSAWC